MIDAIITIDVLSTVSYCFLVLCWRKFEQVFGRVTHFTNYVGCDLLLSLFWYVFCIALLSLATFVCGRAYRRLSVRTRFGRRERRVRNESRHHRLQDFPHSKD